MACSGLGAEYCGTGMANVLNLIEDHNKELGIRWPCSSFTDVVPWCHTLMCVVVCWRMFTRTHAGAGSPPNKTGGLQLRNNLKRKRAICVRDRGWNDIFSWFVWFCSCVYSCFGGGRGNWQCTPGTLCNFTYSKFFWPCIAFTFTHTFVCMHSQEEAAAGYFVDANGDLLMRLPATSDTIYYDPNLSVLFDGYELFLFSAAILSITAVCTTWLHSFSRSLSLEMEEEEEEEGRRALMLRHGTRFKSWSLSLGHPWSCWLCWSSLLFLLALKCAREDNGPIGTQWRKIRYLDHILQ